MLEERESELEQIDHALETSELSEEQKSQLQNLHQQTSEQIILLKAKIENTEISINSYKIACVDLITKAPQAIDHLAVAVLGMGTGKIVENVIENTQGLEDLTNESVEASFVITARVAEQLKESVGGTVLKDATITNI